MWLRFEEKQTISQMHLYLTQVLEKHFHFRKLLTISASICVPVFTNYLLCHHKVTFNLAKSKITHLVKKIPVCLKNPLPQVFLQASRHNKRNGGGREVNYISSNTNQGQVAVNFVRILKSPTSACPRARGKVASTFWLSQHQLRLHIPTSSMELSFLSGAQYTFENIKRLK